MAAAWALLLLASVALSGAQAKEIAVDWTLQPGGANYEPISANVGDTLVSDQTAPRLALAPAQGGGLRLTRMRG